MAIFPLPPGLLARLNVPPTYKSATETPDSAPPAYIAPLNRMSTFRPESIALPPSPSPSPSPAPAPSTSTSASTQQTPPPEYSPSVYSQHQKQQQQRLSQNLPPSSNPTPASLGFPSSPRRPTFAGKAEQEPHVGRFKESRTDLSMRGDLEGGAAQGRLGAKSVLRLYAPLKEGELERVYWRRGVVGVGFGVVVVVVVAVSVCLSVYV